MATVVRKFPISSGPIAEKTAGREVSRRKHARPIKRILDRNTGEVVGWLYQWDTGALSPMWKNKVCEDYILE